ncbi:hypothetical protein DFJ74DRAFT_53980, partial [Hyaloraphidium curvatum]
FLIQTTRRRSNHNVLPPGPQAAARRAARPRAARRRRDRRRAARAAPRRRVAAAQGLGVGGPAAVVDQGGLARLAGRPRARPPRAARRRVQCPAPRLAEPREGAALARRRDLADKLLPAAPRTGRLAALVAVRRQRRGTGGAVDGPKVPVPLSHKQRRLHSVHRGSQEADNGLGYLLPPPARQGRHRNPHSVGPGPDQRPLWRAHTRRRRREIRAAPSAVETETSAPRRLPRLWRVFLLRAQYGLRGLRRQLARGAPFYQAAEEGTRRRRVQGRQRGEKGRRDPGGPGSPDWRSGASGRRRTRPVDGAERRQAHGQWPRGPAGPVGQGGLGARRRGHRLAAGDGRGRGGRGHEAGGGERGVAQKAARAADGEAGEVGRRGAVQGGGRGRENPGAEPGRAGGEGRAAPALLGPQRDRGRGGHAAKVRRTRCGVPGHPEMRRGLMQ